MREKEIITQWNQIEQSQIMKKLNLNFRKILPKKNHTETSSYTYLTNNQILEIIEQFDFFIQLLLQNFLFIKNDDKRLKIQNLIDKINLQKNHFIFESGFPYFDVFLIDFKYGNNSLSTIRNYIFSRFRNLSEDLQKLDPELLKDAQNQKVDNLQQVSTFQIAPQVTVLQSPALETISLINQAVTKNLKREKKISLLNELVPFVQKKHIPMFIEQKSNQGIKFNQIHDLLLLNGLTKFSSKNLPMIQKYFLNFKSLDEIKNRFKNLTRFKSNMNIIKNWKILQIANLTTDEQMNLRKGKIWFGDENYQLISKYFLPYRTAKFLRMNDKNDQKLVIKRSQGYFEYDKDMIEDIVANRISDYFNETKDKFDYNERFIKFLNQYQKSNYIYPRLIPKFNSDITNSYLTIRLSDPALKLTQNNNKFQNCFILNKNSLLAQNIQVRNHRLIFQNTKINKNPGKIKHSFLPNGQTEGNYKEFQNKFNEIKRFCPTLKELNVIAQKITQNQEKECSIHNNEVYQKLYVNQQNCKLLQC